MYIKKLKPILVLLFILITQLVNAQCAMCKAVVENGDNKMAEGINTGIIYLMIFPYLFLALGIYLFFRRYKKNKDNL